MLANAKRCSAEGHTMWVVGSLTACQSWCLYLCVQRKTTSQTCNAAQLKESELTFWAFKGAVVCTAANCGCVSSYLRIRHFSQATWTSLFRGKTPKCLRSQMYKFKPFTHYLCPYRLTEPVMALQFSSDVWSNCSIILCVWVFVLAKSVWNLKPFVSVLGLFKEFLDVIQSSYLYLFRSIHA